MSYQKHHVEESMLQAATFSLIFISIGLSIIVALAALYFRTASANLNLDTLRILARTYYLGNTAALRPFQLRLMKDPQSFDEYSASDLLYEPAVIREHVWYPMIVCVATVFAVSFTLFISYNWKLYEAPNMILGGALLRGQNPPPVREYQLGNLQVILIGFLSAYVWALWQLFRRMVDRDVTVYTFHVITIRIITTIILSITIFHLFRGSEPVTLTPGTDADVFDTFVLAAFCIGFFPEVVLRYLGAKARALFETGDRSTYLDIEMLEGIDTFTRARLAEAGIVEANHLANSNPITLAMRTPFTLPLLIDWAGQAQLLVLLKNAKFDHLRAHGIRTSIQFYCQFAPSIPASAPAAPALAALAPPKPAAATPAATTPDPATPAVTTPDPATPATTTPAAVEPTPAPDATEVPNILDEEVRLACACLEVDPSFRRLKEMLDRMLYQPAQV
jgi:hypothetical protein